MTGRSSHDLIEYYRRELDYLRITGGHFAQRYPKVAHRLQLSGDESRDPHVERLIEAFAFLSARVHLEIDDEFSDISQALLDNLYPSYLCPVPSLSIAQFDADLSEGKLTTGLEIPRHTPLYAQSNAQDDTPCRFRTCYPVTVWPIKVADARFELPGEYDFLTGETQVADVVCLRLTCLGDASFDTLDPGPDRLRLHLHGDWMEVPGLYDLLSSNVNGVAVYAEGKLLARLPAQALQSVGFQPDEDVLPSLGHAHPAYRLLQEYFAFPRKFLFFDVMDLRKPIERLRETPGPHRTLELLFLLNRRRPSGLTIGPETFRLGCTPIANLFRKTTEPVRIDGRTAEYKLVPDWRRESTTEIHSIESVTVTDQQSGRVRKVAPLYALEHSADSGMSAFWWARREHSQRKDVPGTDMVLSFWDLNFAPDAPDVPTVFAHALCTNRRLAEQLQPRTRLYPDGVAARANIRCLYTPTTQITPPLAGETQWRLISQLTLNQVSLLDPSAGLQALQELLMLYNVREEAALQRQIRGIREMSCTSIVRHIGREAWRGFCRGTQITLRLDEEAFVGGSALLLGAVLSHFFALYTSVNSFTQVVLLRGDEEWKTWEPMTGWQQVL
jgi:type VI secretion system protein ImpG